ncbi:MAG TPA: ABC transporter substrate-binding protein [Candidatus Babeliales bacterium]|nr:ABC transporter substrate-binding protein [Candidatus Babeliales bacterium]
MKTKKNTVFLLVSLFVVGFILLYKRSYIQKADALFTIGILQTASHPALDAAREGFIIKIQEKIGKDKNIDFVIRNGQGSINNIHMIAQQFHAKQNIDAVFAIATPAAQAMVSIEKEKPIIIAAVSVAPQLSDIYSAQNVCGVSDMIDVRKEIEAMKVLLPKEMKTIGIIYCTAEVNSVAAAEQMVIELQRVGYIPVLIGVSLESEIESALLSAARMVDVFLAPTDNMVANTITLIVDIARKTNKPFIVSDNMLVKHGPLMARGIDYFESGKQAAEIALQVLVQHKKPQDLPIISGDAREIYVNRKTLEKLGLTIPNDSGLEVVFV